MIEIQNLTKTFNSKNNNIHAVKNCNLTINDGEIFGIIGFSGAGKSTLVRMINALEKPTSGQVLIDSENISALKDHALRKKRMKIGMIFQHFNLLWSRTVERNIELPLEIAGIPKEQRQEKIKKLIHLVGLDGREKAYPSELSGGQKQRISIARVFLKNPPILILDEATSALDNESERLVQKSLESLSVGRTSIIIAHRLSTIRNADEIIVLTSDGIAERGTHEELIAKGGIYYTMLNI